ncbi:MAG: hypothetical protein QM642_01910 [Edaphocola sp.]
MNRQELEQKAMEFYNAMAKEYDKEGIAIAKEDKEIAIKVLADFHESLHPKWIKINSEDWLKSFEKEKGVTRYYVNDPNEEHFAIALCLNDEEKSIMGLSEYMFIKEELDDFNAFPTHYQIIPMPKPPEE